MMPVDLQQLLWLLLPVAAASGWFAAKRSAAKSASQTQPGIRTEYFKGLNYLLNEQPDKAIEVFINMLDVNSDTVETHLALGNLFRRRGEVDRAIRVHQNLIARPSLNHQQRDHALLELGQDYMRAGLLDRAEGLFRELVDKNAHAEPALRELLKIYQQEKDWQSATDVARRLSPITGVSLDTTIAQFYCELAEQALEDQDYKKVSKLLKQAMSFDGSCVRASIIRGDVARLQGDFRGAVKAYRSVEQQDPEFLPEVLLPMRYCYEELKCPGDMISFMKEVVGRYTGVSATLVLADLLLEYEGEQQAASFVEGQLRDRPSVRGFERLVELNLSQGGVEASSNLLMLGDLIKQLLENKPIYKCVNCGFSGKVLHWHCPTCKNWNTVKPIHGVEGE